MRRDRNSFARAMLPALLFVLVPLAARAQPVAAGATVGYELALHGTVSAERGAPVVLHGTAYEVQGWGDLRPTQGLVIDVVLSVSSPDGRTRETLGSVTARSEAGGRFSVEVPLPDADLRRPQLALTVHRSGQPGRTFELSVSSIASREIEILTDRERYEPGETLQLLALVRRARDRAGAGSRDARGADGSERRDARHARRDDGRIGLRPDCDRAPGERADRRVSAGHHG